MQRALLLSLAALVAMASFAASDAEAQRSRRRRTAEPATLVIQSSVQGAEVLVDEEVVGVTPLEDPITLTPGSHTVRVRRPGYTEFTDVVTARAGQRIELPVDLMALSMVLTVRTEPEDARVFVDGTFRGTTPIELELIEGERSIRVTHPNHREVVRRIVALPGQTEALNLTLELVPESERARPPEWFEDPLIWVGVGAGAAALAILIVVLAVAIQPGQSPDTFCPMGSICLRIAPWQDAAD